MTTVEPQQEPDYISWGSTPPRESYNFEQARMRVREQAVVSGWPTDGTEEEYFLRACFPDPPSDGEDA